MARSSIDNRSDSSGADIRRVRDSEAEARLRLAEARIDCERRLSEARLRARDIEARGRRRVERVQQIGQAQLERALARQDADEGGGEGPALPDPASQRQVVRRLATLLIGRDPEGTGTA